MRASCRLIHRVAKAGAAGAPWLAAGRAEAALSSDHPALAAGLAWLVVIGMLAGFLIGAWLLLRHLADKAAAGAGGQNAARFLDLPLGVPEGSVRALVSVFIIVFGFLLLALQAPLGLTASEAITGFLGTVITFYFAARSGEQSRALVEGARDAAERASRAAEQANTAATALPRADAAIAPDPRREALLSGLGEARARLQALRGLAAAAGSLGVGTGAVAGAERALARLDGLLGRIVPVLGGQADAATLGRLAEEAAAALREFGELGPVGNAVSDAMATIGRAASQSTPIANALGGLFGGGAVAGPAGLVAAVVLGGLQLVQEKERFDRWKAAMLDTPLDLGLLPPAVDAGLAAAALRRAPLLAARLAPGGRLEPALALAVWEAVGIPAGQAPLPAREVAARVLDGELPGEAAAALRRHFAASPEALAEAIEELRAAMTGAAALQGLGLDRLRVAGAEVPVAALAGALRTARQDGGVAAEVERLVYLVEALGQADPAARDALAARLGAGETLRAIAAEAEAKARAAAAASTPAAPGTA